MFIVIANHIFEGQAKNDWDKKKKNLSLHPGNQNKWEIHQQHSVSLHPPKGQGQAENNKQHLLILVLLLLCFTLDPVKNYSQDKIPGWAWFFLCGERAWLDFFDITLPAMHWGTSELWMYLCHASQMLFFYGRLFAAEWPRAILNLEGGVVGVA